MGDEDRLIDEIAASPSDRQLRIAYADWLRRQGDFRADYVLAELECVESGEAERASRLRSLAVSHEPEWVARISRPPVGICSNLLCRKPRAGGVDPPRLTNSDLDWVENRFQLKLPIDYRAFLLNYNGGGAAGLRFRFPGLPYDGQDADGVSCFASIWSARESETDSDLDLIWMLQFLEEVRHDEALHREESVRWRGKPHSELMIIGYGLPYRHLHYLCIGCRGDSFGKVFGVTPWLMSADEEDYKLAADSFAQFVSLLMSEGPDQ